MPPEILTVFYHLGFLVMKRLLVFYSAVALLYPWAFVFSQSSDHAIVDKYELIEFDTRGFYDIIKSLEADDDVTLSLVGEGLTLYKTSVVSPAYTLINNGQVVDNTERAISLHGHTSSGGNVRLTIAPGFLMASLQTSDGKRWIELTDGFIESSVEDLYITYLESDIIADPQARCGVHQVDKVAAKYEQGKSAAMGTCYTIEYAICHDYSMTNLLGTMADVESFGIAITNEINDLYDNQFADILEFSITGQYISTSTANDPWSTSTDVAVLLPSFSAWATTNLAFPHDVATLWTNRNLEENGNSGANGFSSTSGSICTNNRYNLCEHLSTAGLNRIIVSHQIGHNFDLQHVSGLFVMSAFSAPTFTTWSATSITNIETYYNSLPNGCLDSPCGAVTPTIGWAQPTSTVEEINTNTTLGGLCNERYIDHTLLITKSNFSVDNINVGVTIDASSTAGFYDFELLNFNVTFVSGGSLVQPLTVRIYDDAIEESSETISLTLSINSGNATLGTATHTMTINNLRDKVSASCCSQDSQTEWDPGAPYNTWPNVLAGNNPEFRSRYILTASQLSAAGLTPGPISEIQLNVDTKNSTSAYNGLTIKLANSPGSTLPAAWINTTTVFSQSYNTALGWNAFPFSAPFTWDGTSSLYVEVCFSGGSAGGDDYILTKTIVTANNAGYVTPSGSTTICTDPVASNNAHTLIPITRLISSSGAQIETVTTPTVSSSMSSGETGHFYSDDDKVIASIENSGPTELSCVDVSVNTSGLGQSTLAGSVNYYSDKTTYVSPFGLDFYDISIYYTAAELAIWSPNINDLSVVKSDVDLSSTTENQLEVLPTTITSFAGINGGMTFTARASGAGYYAITDRRPEEHAEVGGSLSIEHVGDGIVLSSPNGTRYLLSDNSSGILDVSLAPPLSASQAKLQDSDFFLSNNGSIYLQDASGANTSRYSMSNVGTLLYSPSVTPAAPLVRVYNGNFEVSSSNHKFIMSSPGGVCYAIKVTDFGILDITPTGCP